MERFDDIVIERFGAGTPVLTEDLIALFPDVTEATVFNAIKRSLSDGALERYQRGVYFVPRENALGRVPLSAVKVVERRWLRDGDGVCGYYSGSMLENKVGLTTQVPAVLEITTNKEKKRVREVSPFGGWRKIELRAPRTKITDENVDALRLLDILTRVSPAKLERYELEKLGQLARKVGRGKAVEYARFYPGKTSKNLMECEVLGVFA